MHFEKKRRCQPFTALLAGASLLQAAFYWAPISEAAQNSAPQTNAAPATLKSQTPKLAPTETTEAQTAESAKPTEQAQPTSAAATKKGANSAKKSAGGNGTKGGSASMPPKAPELEKYPKVGELENLMFGVSHSNIPIEFRLDRLESEVFHHTNPDWDMNRRIERLSQTLVGGGAPTAAGADSGVTPHSMPSYPSAGDGLSTYGSGYPYGQPSYGQQQYDLGDSQRAQSTASSYCAPPTGDLNSPEFQKELDPAELQKYAMEVINDSRSTQSLGPLESDDVANKVAAEIVADNCKRNTVSHQDAQGNNPDLRYTKAGGNDCMVESIASIQPTDSKKLSKAVVYNTLKELMSHQDDRDALFSSHATHCGFSVGLSSGRDKFVACTEVVTKQGEVAAIPSEIKVGEKVDVKGFVKGPYKFQRITVAWEGTLPTPNDNAEEQDEALPYFPPLDFEAYGRHSEHDWTRAKQTLQFVGIAAAIAAGMFVPPAALAAPLIAAGGGAMNKPKAVSDIPIHGGVHTDGASFEHKLSVSKDNKEGIYYITVWAATDMDPTPFAISRRAVVARAEANEKAAPNLKISHTTEELISESPPPKKSSAHKKRDKDEGK